MSRIIWGKLGGGEDKSLLLEEGRGPNHSNEVQTSQQNRFWGEGCIISDHELIVNKQYNVDFLLNMNLKIAWSSSSFLSSMVTPVFRIKLY